MSEGEKKTALYGIAALIGVVILFMLLRQNGETQAQVIETGGGVLPITPFSQSMDLPAPVARPGAVYNIYGGTGGPFIFNDNPVTVPSSYLPPRTGNPVPIFIAGNGNYPSIAAGDCCGCGNDGLSVDSGYNSSWAGTSMSASMANETSGIPWWAGSAPGGR